MANSKITELLGDKAEYLLNHQSKTISKDQLHLPGPDFVDRIWTTADRNPQVCATCRRCIVTEDWPIPVISPFSRLTRALNTVPVLHLQRIPIYFDPENIIKLAMEGGCNAVATTYGGLGFLSRKYAHKIPFIVKINHNEFLTYPNKFDQIMFASIKASWNLGAAAVGATIYFGSDESARQIQEVSKAFEMAHELGMATILWCYLRNPAFKTKEKDYHVSADLTGQANHLGVTIEADIIKQKLPENNGGYLALNTKESAYGKNDKRIYEELTTDHPIDLCRYQVANCYMGRAGLINSGGASSGASDMAEAVTTAVINKRAGGMGLISGRKAFQRPMKEGVEILNAIQDVYLDKGITIA